MLAANEIKVESNELVQILTLSSEEILQLSSPFGCELARSPVYTYPFFGESELVSLTVPSGTDESILESLEVVLCVNLSVEESGCFCFLGSSEGGKRILRSACEVIEAKLIEMAQGAKIDLEFISDWSEYQTRIKKEACLSHSNVSDQLNMLQGDFYRMPRGVTFDFYSRVQATLLPFFIEAATPIDLSDPKWTVYLNISTPSTPNGDCHSIIPAVCRAFMTTYNYFRFPEGLRVRISQILVFPRFQSARLGSSLYTAVTGALRADEECAEICVEDPTDGFERLRGICDYLTWQVALKKKNNNNNIIDDSTLESSLKITKDHAERLRILAEYLESKQQKSSTVKRSKTSTSPASCVDDGLRKRIKLNLLRKFRKDLPDSQSERFQKLTELFESEVEEFLVPVSERIVSEL